jgi:hypothetical protein
MQNSQNATCRQAAQADLTTGLIVIGKSCGNADINGLPSQNQHPKRRHVENAARHTRYVQNRT